MTPSRKRIAPTRRGIIQAAGAGTAAWLGLSVTATGAAAQDDTGDPEDDALLVLIYDDSPEEDYTQTFPIHQEYDVPGCLAVCPGLMETGSPWLDPAHLEEMHEEGWEVMSHTLEHRSLGAIPVRSDIEEGDTEIHVQASLHGRFEGDPLYIYNPDRETTATAAGRGEDGDDQLLILEEPIDESFDAGDGFQTWVRYTDEFIDSILEESRDTLEEWGVGPVTAYVHTYDRYDGYVSEVVADYYEAVPNRHKGPFNPTADPNPHELSRANFETDRLEFDEIEEILDVIAEDADFGILYGHSHHQAMTAERIEETIEAAEDRDIRIVTLQEALVEIGVWADKTGELAVNDDDDDDDDDDIDDEPDDEPDDDDEMVGDDTDDEGEEDDADDDVDLPADDEPTDDDEMIGFGAIGAVAGVAGAGYVLARRRSNDGEEQ